MKKVLIFLGIISIVLFLLPKFSLAQVKENHLSVETVKLEKFLIKDKAKNIINRRYDNLGRLILVFDNKGDTLITVNLYYYDNINSLKGRQPAFSLVKSQDSMIFKCINRNFPQDDFPKVVNDMLNILNK
ncbi:MAG: hypothetical protein WCI41_01670 [bacterium]